MVKKSCHPDERNPDDKVVRVFYLERGFEARFDNPNEIKNPGFRCKAEVRVSFSLPPFQDHRPQGGNPAEELENLKSKPFENSA